MQILFNDTFAVFTEFSVFTSGQFPKAIPFASLAGNVFRAQAASQPAAGDSKFSLHSNLPPFKSAGMLFPPKPMSALCFYCHPCVSQKSRNAGIGRIVPAS